MRWILVAACLVAVFIVASTWVSADPDVVVEAPRLGPRPVETVARLTPHREATSLDTEQVARSKPTPPMTADDEQDVPSAPVSPVPGSSTTEGGTPRLPVVMATMDATEEPRPRLGITVAQGPTFAQLKTHLDLRAEGGTLVSEVAAGSPAEKAGLVVTDILLALNGAPLKDGEHLIQLLRDRRAGQQLMLDLYRGAKPVTLQVTLAEEPRGTTVELPPNLPSTHEEALRKKASSQPSSGGWLGISTTEKELTLLCLQTQLRLKGGVCVESVIEGSVAHKEGLKAGDVIVEFNGQPLLEAGALIAQLNDLGFDRAARFSVLHEGTMKDMILTFPKEN